MEEIEKAIKQLKQAMKNIDKAEEKACAEHRYLTVDALERASLDIAVICDILHAENETLIATSGKEN